MPELPEVETIKLGLQRKIVGLKIKKVDVLNSKIFQGDVKGLEGKEVVVVWRRAKMLGIDLSVRGPVSSAGPVTRQPHAFPTSRLRRVGPPHGAPRLVPPAQPTLLFHLKMTGQLIFVEGERGERLIGGHPTPDMRDQMPNTSTRVIFEFSNGSKLYFNDQRKFGWVKVVENCKLTIDNLFQNVGPEPLSKYFTWQILKSNLLNHKSQPIKVVLMDQSLVAGIGNIYASESLFLAKVDPRRKVSSLSDDDFKNIYKGIIDSLKLAIQKGGSTRAHFVNVEGERGYFLDYAKVYGKEGKPCSGCKGKIVKIVQASRGTYFCPVCQK